MIDFLAQHSFWSGVGTLWAFSALVSGMPAPDSTSGKGYLWAFNSLHSLAGNLTTAFAGKVPGIQEKN